MTIEIIPMVLSLQKTGFGTSEATTNEIHEPPPLFLGQPN